MMYNTLEERGCQAPVGTNGTPEDWNCQTQTTNKPVPPLYDKIKQGSGLTSSDLNAIVEEISGKPIITPVAKVIDACNQPNETPAKKKSIEESRKLLDTFKEKVATYPKCLTYEGAVVLCVMLSVNVADRFNLDGMPIGDKALIVSLLPECAVAHLKRFDATIGVEFDSERDFVMTYKHKDDVPTVLKFFNTVIHPQHLESNAVPVEGDGEKISLGGKLVFDKKRIQQLVGVGRFSEIPTPRKEEEEFVRRQPVSGRNAYEIRADVLQMAVDWSGNRSQKPEEIIEVANKFYGFVEDRRRR